MRNSSLSGFLLAAALLTVGCGVDDAGSSDPVPPATGPAATGPAATGPAATEPAATELPATEPPTTEPASIQPRVPDAYGDSPPPIVVRRGDVSLSLAPFTYCWTPPPADGATEVVGICADGVRPDPPLDLGGDGLIRVEFPAELNFRFSGTVYGASYDNAAGGLVAVEPGDATGAGVWTFESPSALPALVDVVGVGPAGDVHISIRLT